MVDFFLLLMLAGAGDELQGIKRGIMEMADAIAITKADGNNLSKAELAAVQYANALHLFPKSPSGWSPKVLLCSAVKDFGIDAIWQSILDYVAQTQENQFFYNRRREQAKYWMYETINEALHRHFYHHPNIEHKLEDYEQRVLDDQLSSFTAARKLLQKYFGPEKIE